MIGQEEFLNWGTLWSEVVLASRNMYGGDILEFAYCFQGYVGPVANLYVFLNSFLCHFRSDLINCCSSSVP